MLASNVCTYHSVCSQKTEKLRKFKRPVSRKNKHQFPAELSVSLLLSASTECEVGHRNKRRKGQKSCDLTKITSKKRKLTVTAKILARAPVGHLRGEHLTAYKHQRGSIGS